MAEELTGQGAGVEQGQATTDTGVAVPPTAAPEGQTIAEATQAPPAAKPVDLTTLPEFRAWQAARDKRDAQLQAQLQEERRQREGMQRQLAELQLRDADPEEVAAYYQQQLAEAQQRQELDQQQATERAEIVRQGEQLLKDLGLSADTPGLEWSQEPTWEGLATLAKSAAKVKALQQQAVTQTQTGDAEAAAQAAKVEALRAAGVTKTTSAVGPPPKTDLETQYKQELAALKGTGDAGAFAAVRSKYRKLGLDL